MSALVVACCLGGIGFAQHAEPSDRATNSIDGVQPGALVYERLLVYLE